MTPPPSQRPPEGEADGGAYNFTPTFTFWRPLGGHAVALSLDLAAAAHDSGIFPVCFGTYHDAAAVRVAEVKAAPAPQRRRRRAKEPETLFDTVAA